MGRRQLARRCGLVRKRRRPARRPGPQVDVLGGVVVDDRRAHGRRRPAPPARLDRRRQPQAEPALDVVPASLRRRAAAPADTAASDASQGRARPARASVAPAAAGAASARPAVVLPAQRLGARLRRRAILQLARPGATNERVDPARGRAGRVEGGARCRALARALADGRLDPAERLAVGRLDAVSLGLGRNARRRSAGGQADREEEVEPARRVRRTSRSPVVNLDDTCPSRSRPRRFSASTKPAGRRPIRRLSPFFRAETAQPARSHWAGAAAGHGAARVVRRGLAGNDGSAAAGQAHADVDARPLRRAATGRRQAVPLGAPSLVGEQRCDNRPAGPFDAAAEHG